MFTRIFGKPKQEANTLTTLDKLNEVNWIWISQIGDFFFQQKELCIVDEFAFHIFILWNLSSFTIFIFHEVDVPICQVLAIYKLEE